MSDKGRNDNLIDRIVRKTITCILKKEVDESKCDGIVQFIKFGIVGVSNTIVNYVIYCAVLLGLSGFRFFAKTDYIFAQIIAFVLSVLWSFYWNNKYVFRERENRVWWKALFKTYASYAFTGLFLNVILSFVWVEILGISKLISPIINLLVSVPVNFLMNKFWAFKN